jgi:hypothetical protein
MSDGSGALNSDWRMTGQDSYLRGVKLFWRKYTRYSETWDHDHCEFCLAKFMVEDHPGVLHKGYSTEDQRYWVCKSCFEDFKERFEWESSVGRAKYSGGAS